MSAPTRRLFFALWPDDRVREEIVERRRYLGGVGGRRVPDHNLHLTLLFLGDQPSGRVEDLEAAADAIRAEACTLVLDHFGWFPGARVLWLGGDAPEALASLQGELLERVSSLGVALDARPFRPHVTLLRRVDRRPRLCETDPTAWPIRHFVLVESRPARPYRVLAQWPIGSPA